ncbi:MAG: PKD domain-containing protein [Prevotella sp.]|nr:PKD domain-containing protein [Prevotella sp.]
MKMNVNVFNRRWLLLVAVLAGIAGTAAAQTLTADFAADEAASTYYEQGWDSQDEAATWTYDAATGRPTWTLAAKPAFAGSSYKEPFSTIEPQSRTSLSIAYSMTDKDETATSPVVTVLPGSSVEYYVCVYAIWYIYADLKFFVTDVASGQQTQLSSVFAWAQNEGFDGPNWVKFSFPLSEYEGRQVRFAFQYKGNGGENVYIDGFRVKQRDLSADATVHVAVGKEVHFRDLSSGSPTRWLWEFEGGTPATSTEQHPTVTYAQTGTYGVKLTVSNDAGEHTATRAGYVVVQAEAPIALIGAPTEGYLSPFALRFVPTDVPVQFHDLSSGNPTAWSWTFEGGTPATSAEQHPTVTYAEAGTYGLTLDVSNDAGTAHDFLQNAIQAGGQQYVWNIEPEEIDGLSGLSLGSYGYYAGTNGLLIDRFAERFDAPLAEVKIDAVQVYFNTTTTDQPFEQITVSLCAADANGLPGQQLATASVRAGDLQYDAQNVVPTDFTFATPVRTAEAFFVVIDGMCQNTEGDLISILCVRRDDGQPTTTYHYLSDEGKWYLNSDDPVSMAVTPRLKYVTADDDEPQEPTGISTATAAQAAAEAVYDIQGRRLSGLQRGMNIVRMADGRVRKVMRR